MASKNLMSVNPVTQVNDSDMFYTVQGGATDGRVSAIQISEFVTLGLTKADVGLANVDNTSDINKPISSATQLALDAKQGVLQSGINIKTVNGQSILGSGNIDVAGDGASDLIRTPVAISPLTGTMEFPVDGTLQASAYAPLYSVDAREFREFQIDLVSGDFTAPISAAQVNADTWAISPAIPDNTDLQWRCRDKSVNGDYSEWSESQTFKAFNNYVVTPVITYPTEGGTVAARNQPITATAFQMVNAADTHAASYWTIKDSLGTVVYKTGRDTVNLTSWQPPAGVIVDGESMTVEVVYESSGGFLSEAGVRGFVGVAGPFGKYLAVVHDVTPFVTNYGMDVDNFTNLASPSSLPAGNSRDVAFSSDGNYMAVGHEVSPYITIYKRSGDTFAKLANPSVLPTGLGLGVAFSPNGNDMAVAHLTSPFVTIYKRIGDTFTKLANPDVLPTGTGRDVAFSSDGNYMAVSHNSSPFVTIYKRSGDTFAKLANPSVLPTGLGLGVAFSPNGNYMAVGHLTSPFVTIYKRIGDTFAKLANPSTLPTNSGNAVAFSSDGNYMAVGHTTTPFITIYKRSGDTFTKLANPDVLPTGTVRAVAFSSDGNYMAVGHEVSPYITIYKHSGGTFTKLANPDVLPTGIGFGVAFWPSALYSHQSA